MPETVRIRCIMPDRWLEAHLEVPTSTRIGELKRQCLEALLKTRDVDPQAYYVEHLEREVSDESVTLRELGVRDPVAISVRPYDLNHPRPYRG